MKMIRSLHTLAHALHRRLKGFARAQGGISAVEFALIAPVLVLVYLSCVEVNLLMRADRRVTTTASTLGDLTARLNNASNSDFRELYDAATVMMQPYPASGTRMRITSIVDNGNGQKRVAWSEGYNIAPYAVNTLMNVPAGIVQQPGSVILTEVEYDYTSRIGFMFDGAVTLKDRFYLRPRRVTKIERVAGPPGSVAFGPAS